MSQVSRGASHPFSTLIEPVSSCWVAGNAVTKCHIILGISDVYFGYLFVDLGKHTNTWSTMFWA